MKRESTIALCVFVFLVTVGTLTRLASNEWQLWNFASVTASALFAGFYLRNVLMAALVPLSIVSLSNLALPPYGSKFDVIGMYVLFTAPVLLGPVLRKHFKAEVVAASAVGSSAFFFLVSNFLVWLTGQGLSSNLIGCYIDAIPFYQATLASDLVWSAVLFGSYTLAAAYGYLPMQKAEVRVPKRVD